MVNRLLPVRDQIWRDILNERTEQARKWGRPHAWGYGDCSSTDVADIVKSAVLAEECGEVARAVLDEVPAVKLRVELVQVAAVAVAWIECLHRETPS